MTINRLDNKHVDDNPDKTNNMIKISIIIPVYNYIQYTRTDHKEDKGH